MTTSIQIPGTPRAQPRPTPGNYGRPAHIQAWYRIVREAVKKHLLEHPDEWPALQSGALAMLVSYRVPVQDKKRWGKPSVTKPDIDNYNKLLLDAWVQGGILAGLELDDNVIADLRSVKRWCQPGSAGCSVRVVPWSDIYPTD
jgi:Holliday junction resolvase RusA-like endonuclease